MGKSPLPFPTPVSRETLGIVRIHTAAESRLSRRGNRPYEHVLKLGKLDVPPLFTGYKLVLEGRFTTFPNGRVAHCWSESVNHRPICLYAVVLDRVAFETGDTGRVLAEWRE